MLNKYTLNVFLITNILLSIYSPYLHAKKKQKELAIFFTTSTNGYLEPCDCPGRPQGGLVRIATYLKKKRSQYRHNMLFDSGDFFKPHVSELLARYMLKAYTLLDYDAVGVGDHELTSPHFLNFMEKSKIPFLSSNVIIFKNGEYNLLAPRVKKIKRAGMKILIASAVHENTLAIYPENKKKHLTILSVDDSISDIIYHNKNAYDLFILISHCGITHDKVIAQRHPEIDIIISGHSKTLLSKPIKIRKTLIVHAGSYGSYVGKLLLTINKDKTIDSWKYETVPIRKNIADDSRLQKLINKYKKEKQKK